MGFYKYTDFVLENLNAIFDSHFPLPEILLPLALSFITFQQIGFLVDCYHNQETQKIDFLDYMLFITFFPQLIAGPIVHHKEMMPQFHTLLQKYQRLIDWEKFAKGLFIFSIGLFKKVVIADSFATWANAGFDATKNGEILNLFESWVTSLSYTFQLYFDFSGYCDMAIGLGLFFGIVLPINFNSPYKALNIQDFWRRWHITLGRFLRNYLYIPLGGNQKGKSVEVFNLFIVFVIGGIWHGAGWGFIIWGMLHGGAMGIHRIYSFMLERLRHHSNGYKNLVNKVQNNLGYKVLAWFITFNFLNFAWVFFRAQTLEGAFNLIKGMIGMGGVVLPSFLEYKMGSFGEMLKQMGVEFGGMLKNIEPRSLLFVICAFICTFILLCIKNTQYYTNRISFNTYLSLFISLCICLSLLFINKESAFLYFNF